jgi:predicted RNase H-like HicB family nuclease
MTPRPEDFLIIIEGDGSTNYGAWAPDVLGCVSTGPTVEACAANMRDALAFHFEGMTEDGDPIPTPTRPGGMQLGDPDGEFDFLFEDGAHAA